MPKGKSHERFGPFVLFRRLESDALGEIWRGVEWKPDSFGDPVVVHRLTGGDAAAIRAAAEKARPIVGGLTGTTVARDQRVGFADGVSWLAHRYPGGRSLQSIVNKARATGSVSPNPVPVDQALAVVEKLALSVESLENVRYQGSRVTFGSVLPQFVWISEEGEVRAAGQQIGPGVLASISQPDVAREYAAYFAPELRTSPATTRSSDVWSLGAVLYLILTGEPLPDPASADAVQKALASPILMHQSTPVPQEILSILRRSLATDPAERYPSATEMRADLEKLLNSGEYAPTTFNLAFYLSGLLRKELESETAEREKEATLDPAEFATTSPRIVPTPAAPAAPAAVRAPEPAAPSESPFRSAPEEPARGSRGPLLIGIAALLLVAAGVGGWLMFGSRDTNAAQTASMVPAQQTPPPAPAPAAAPVAIQPIVAQGSEDPASSTQDGATREEEINRRLQEEVLKLQAQYEREIAQQRRQAEAALQNLPAERPRSTPARTTPAPAESAPARETAAPAAQTTTSAPPATTPPPQQQPAAAAPAVQERPALAQTTPEPAAPPAIREGDLVALSLLDRGPELTAPVRPTYPPLALRRRMEGSVIVSVLVNESGRVEDVKILRGDSSRLGFDEAAVKAIRQATFTPPMKDGKRVKTWKPVPVVFKP